MIESTQYKTPGQLIQALLDERGWTQRVLAVVLNMSEPAINKMITGKQAVDAETALALSGVLQYPAERFLELQKSYELAQARLVLVDDPDMTARAQLFGSLPIAEMMKRGWLDVDNIKNIPKVESEVARFFCAKSINEVEIFPHAAKKTNVADDVTPVQLAWLYRVKEIAKEMLVGRYSPEAVLAAVPKLKELRSSAEAARKVPRILTECGIRFAIVESLPGSKIDGVCFWLDESSPVIGLAMRYDRIDNFWFVLRHELEHVLQLHGQITAILDSELEGDRGGDNAGLPEEERVANQAAADFCVPDKSMKSFIARKSPIFKEQDIIGFSRTMGVHPGLVAGQLQRRLNRYDRFRNHLVKIRSAIAPSAMVDGWGDVAPVG
ncbi:MAG TPA: helix-turn-helix domain-containing protein [Candidatus Sulfotelmatobacter sp.]|nr:helix-turn-helix domain-containing protein [Candidatus Sulfotelmatobacter sp.]